MFRQDKKMAKERTSSEEMKIGINHLEKICAYYVSLIHDQEVREGKRAGPLNFDDDALKDKAYCNDCDGTKETGFGELACTSYSEVENPYFDKKAEGEKNG